jgi:hypothetical protein
MRITSQNEETNRCSYFCGDLCFCPTDRAAIADAAVKWITLAANLGDKQGQANLADVCLEDKLVKQDLIEAYKWGGLPPWSINRTSCWAESTLIRYDNLLSQMRQKVARGSYMAASAAPCLEVNGIRGPAFIYFGAANEDELKGSGTVFNFGAASVLTSRRRYALTRQGRFVSSLAPPKL